MCVRALIRMAGRLARCPYTLGVCLFSCKINVKQCLIIFQQDFKIARTPRMKLHNKVEVSKETSIYLPRRRVPRHIILIEATVWIRGSSPRSLPGE